MPLSGRILVHILLGLALLPSGARGLPSLLVRDSTGADYSPPRRTAANDVAAALISVLVVTAIVLWLIRRLVSRARTQVEDMFLGTTDNLSDNSK
ncbi:hypothetical protein C8A03DRAFT_17239 [Achaetomium macrosporum]|uniref:Uncharacterized protein n=1 Tax=Achaetomium macrosporum TaxID=79813 RepID=A0AAN7C6G2_9PEZI|nr:hypothetical protein C8A03DRAFT_17239 [Achaetomium macrosporum]